MRLSGEQLADRIGCSPAAISIAKNRGRLVHGQWPVSAWAVHNADGRLEYYDVPSDCPLVSSDEVTERKAAEDDADEAEDLVHAAAPVLDAEQIKEIVRSELRENPKPEERRDDYVRPVSAGGLSYVMGKAVDGDSGTARAGVLCAGSLFGALIGHEVSDHWSGALVGAILVGGLGWQAMRSTASEATPAATESPTPTADAHAGMTATEGGNPFHIPDAHAGTHEQPIRAVGT